MMTLRMLRELALMFLTWLHLQLESTPTPTSDTPPPKYLWDTPGDTRHSVRVICDEEGLTLYQKNVITACIQQESNFKNSAVNHNRNVHTGEVLSSDWGLCQINDHYHIGVGKDFPSVGYVVNNPDRVVRFMIRMYKVGKLNLWVSYKSGAYLKWMP